LPPSEPRYAGKKLTFWLSRLNNDRLPPQERAEVTNAIITIGTNNLDLLIKWFQEPEPPYKEPWLPRATSWLDSKQHLVRFSRPMAEPFNPSHPGMAWWVLHGFPSVSRLAMPPFTNMLCHGDLETRGKALMILDGVGEDALPVVLPLLSSGDPTNRALALIFIGNRGPDALPLIPKVQTFLDDKSPYPRLAAADALIKLHSDPRPLIPVLVQLFREGSADIKLGASESLGAATNCASLATTGLLELFSETTNRDDRLNIYFALEKLDTNAADALRSILFPDAPKLNRSPPKN
jgi:hypothetical protein